MIALYRFFSDFLIYLIFFSWFPFVSIHLTKKWGGETGELLSCIAVLGVVISLYTAHLSDRFDKKK